MGVTSLIKVTLTPELDKALKEKNVEIFACERTRSILPNVQEATEEDWYKEYLDLKIAVRVVDSLEEAIDHINKYGTKHSESIVTQDEKNAKIFPYQFLSHLFLL